MILKKKVTNSSCIKNFVLVVITSLLIAACKENPNEFKLGEKYIESQTDLSLIDTFTVKLSTVILDTVVTSGTGSLLIGNYSDVSFGKIECNSYLQVAIPGNIDYVDNQDVYDSISLVIRYNKYSFGDTTKAQKISVHQLTENIRLDENNVITNGTTFNYNPEVIGSIVYVPQPNNDVDSLAIKINDEIGLDLFSKIKTKSEILNDNESFKNYFHGLVLVADKAYDGAIIGFSARDVKLMLYTSDVEDKEEEIIYEFILHDTTKQFNNIKHDFSSTQLSSLIEQRSSLSSEKTGGQSFLQAGIGLVIRVDFPSLAEILLRSRGTIVKGQLSISPLNGSYNEFNLPDGLVLYDTDKSNRTSSSQYSIASTLSQDELYYEQTSYSFDITNYLIDILSYGYIDSGSGFIINVSEGKQQSTFERLVVDALNQNTKLKIYYLSY